MRIGDKVIISPELTHYSDWTEGCVIEVEQNPYIGTVVSAKIADGNIFFGRSELFKSVSACTQ